MTNVTLEGIAALLAEELKPIDERLDNIDGTLKNHTKILDTHSAALQKLLTEKKTKDDNKTVSDSRLDYLEHWAKEVSQKLGLDFKR